MATLNRQDLEFILQQIQYSRKRTRRERIWRACSRTRSCRSACARSTDRSTTSCLVSSEFGAADNPFPRLVDPVFRDDADGDTFDANGPGPGGVVTNTDYGAPGNVADADPRIISNLVADQTITQPGGGAGLRRRGARHSGR